ncbi:MAG: hypothetical protein L3J62_00110 [Gammaproteobacteria bacterium]|nr:hypothetical protein [Gammaproteobacteria bacterium]
MRLHGYDIINRNDIQAGFSGPWLEGAGQRSSILGVISTGCSTPLDNALARSQSAM